MLKQKQSH